MKHWKYYYKRLTNPKNSALNNLSRVHMPQNNQTKPHGVMVKALDCAIVVREFEIQLHCCIHFRTNTLGKGMNLLVLPSMGLWGMWLKVTGKGQGCVAVCISDSIFWLFHFTPTLSGRYNALPKKVPKELYKRRQQQVRDEDVSFILSFIYWVQQPFHGWGSFSWIHWNGWILQLRCQKYVKSFHVCVCPHLVFRASIRVSFLLEVCQSPVRVSL